MWRRPNTNIMSTIDRVNYDPNLLQVKDTRTDWSLSMSDLAAVIENLVRPKGVSKYRLKIPRLDLTLLLVEEAKTYIFNKVKDLIEEAPNT